MAPTTVAALGLIVGFVLPGYVALVISERTHVVPTPVSPFERLLRSLYYSGWVYAVLLAAGAALWSWWPLLSFPPPSSWSLTCASEPGSRWPSFLSGPLRPVRRKAR